MELADRTFLVTGGSGFIGSHVVDELVAAGARAVVLDAVVNRANLADASASGRVRIVEGDITDPAPVRSATAGVDGVFHLAVLPLGDCVSDPRRCLEVNVLGTFNVLEAAREEGVRKVVFSSASSVYGETAATMDEAHPLDARTMYGASKIAGEYVTRAFEDMYGVEYVILRYMNVYGPRQQGGLVVNVVRRILAGEPPTITGDGSQSFDFIHVRDVARANLAAMASDVSGETFNVGSGTEVTVREVVERLLAVSGSALEPEYRVDERVLMSRRVGSSEKARRVLGWAAGVPLDDGVGDVVASFRNG